MQQLKDNADSIKREQFDDLSSMHFLARNVEAVDTCQRVVHLQQNATQLYLNTLNAADRKAEEERLQQRQERQVTIHTANADIFSGITPKTEAKRLTKTMQREFDLMMYNFSDDELELYETYSRHHVAVRDPLVPGSKNNRIINNYLHNGDSQYYPTEKKCDIKFNNSSYMDSMIGDYLPRFAWNTRFHEETHHLDAIFGDDYNAAPVAIIYEGEEMDVSPNKGLSRPEREGKKMQDALIKESLHFVNQAFNQAIVSEGKEKIPELKQFDILSMSRKDDRLDAILDKLVAEQTHYNSDSAFVDLIDLLGLCSRGIIDKRKLVSHRKKRIEENPNDPRYVTWYGIVIGGHETWYNRRVLTLGEWYCDETAEALAEFTAARLSGKYKSDLHRVDRKYLPESYQEGLKLIKRMISIMHSDGFIWPENN